MYANHYCVMANSIVVRRISVTRNCATSMNVSSRAALSVLTIARIVKSATNAHAMWDSK